MNFEQHILIAILVGIALAYIQTLTGAITEIYQAGLFVIICIAFGILPDMIEPAVDYNHRKFFHSQKLFDVMKIPALILIAASLLPYIGYFTSFAGYTFAGYYSHLISDHTTPMGLHGSNKHKSFIAYRRRVYRKYN